MSVTRISELGLEIVEEKFIVELTSQEILVHVKFHDATAPDQNWGICKTVYGTNQDTFKYILLHHEKWNVWPHE